MQDTTQQIPKDVNPSERELLTFLKSQALFASFDETILQRLTSGMEWVHLQEGDILFRQGEPGEFLYLVYDGCLRVLLTRDDGVEINVADVGPGKPLGEIQFLTGGTRTASVSALRSSILLQLSRTTFEHLSKQFPDILQQMAEIIRQRLRRDQLVTILPELCGPIDADMLTKIEAETEWIWLPKGEALCQEGDPGDSFFLLISGRLYATVQHRDGKERMVGEVQRGEIVGEMSIFTGEPRSASIYAARNSEVVKFSKPAFERITAAYPSIMMRIVKIVIRRLQKSQSSTPVTAPGMNVAIVPVNSSVPLREFATRLTAALSKFGDTLHLDSEHLDQLLNMSGASQIPEDAPNNVRLAAWLDEQETQHRIVVYETDSSPSPWTQRCVQRADRILVVANAGDNPETGQIERQILDPENKYARTRHSLVLLHPHGEHLPQGTRQWLVPRNVDDHYHLRWDVDADFGRIARFLTGNAIGLVLGGGGARGCAHIGVIRALLEADIPIDMIGGTSIGGAIAALHAMGVRYNDMLRINRQIWINSKPFNDYTLPLMSLIRGKKFEHIAQDVYGERPIEDLWVNYFCVSTNITTTKVVVHREGSLWRALRATASLPGIAVPLIDGSNLLVDGGVLNNLPIDVMRDLCGGIVIAVDVSPEKDLTVDYEQFPSPWKVLWNRMIPTKHSLNVPNILDMLLRATMVGSIHQTNAVKGSADLYLQPPLSQFRLLDFKALEAIADVGYAYTTEQLTEWRPSFLRT